MSKEIPPALPSAEDPLEIPKKIPPRRIGIPLTIVVKR
jgi:hypothetical protein